MIAKAMNVKPPEPINVGAQTPGATPEQLGGSLLQGAKETASDLYTGGVKKFGDTIATISSGLNKLPWIGETLAPKVGVQSFKAQMQPDNTTQKIGGGLEQAGEMTLAGGPLRAGAETLATKLPFLGKLAAPLMRVGAEALNSGSNAALHGEPVGTSSAIGGTGAAVGEALPFLAPYLRKKAVAQYSEALAPTTKQNKAITQDIVPQLIARGERGSLQGLEETATRHVNDLSPQLDSEYNALQQASPKLPVRNAQTGRMAKGAVGQIPASGKQVISDLEDLKKTYMPGGKVAQPQAVAAIQGVQDIVKQYGPNISPTNLRRLRQIFEEVPAQRGAYAGADLSTNYTLRAQQAAADSIRGILNSSKSDIGALNREISFWLDVQRVTRDSGLRRTGQVGGLMKVFGPLGTAVAGAGGFAAHGAATGLEAGAATALSTAVYQARQSPLWKTTSAVVKDRLATALASGNAAEVSRLLARFGVGLQGSTQPTAQGDPTRALAQ